MAAASVRGRGKQQGRINSEAPGPVKRCA